MKIGTAPNKQVVIVHRLMEMLAYAEQHYPAVVPYIEQAIRNTVLEA